MLFADDIILLSAPIAGLLNNISALYNVANRLRLQVNFSKTRVMVFQKGITFLPEKDGTVALTD